MITEKEFLKLLVENMNEKHEVHHSKAMELSGLDDDFYLDYCKSLKRKDYIRTDSEFITLTALGVQSIQSGN